MRLITYKKNKGFSLLEVIIGIFIVSLAMVGILSLIIQNIQVQNINKNDLVAIQLAQEGVELVRRTRDNNWLLANWAFLDIADVDAIKSFAIDSSGITDGVVMGDNNARLMTDTGYYLHAGSELSNFRRIIETTNDYTASSTIVECKVQWTEKNQTHEQVVSEILHDWR